MSSSFNSSHSRPRRARFGLLIAALVAAAAVAGCGGGGYLTPEQRAEVIKKDRDSYGALGYRHEWSGFPTMTRGARVQSFEILGDVLAVLDSAGELSIIEANSAAVRWHEALATPLTRFVGIVRDTPTGRIVVCSESEAFYLDADTGTLLAKQQLDRVVSTRPIVLGEMLVFGTSTGEIFGQLKMQGFRMWGNTVQGGIESNGVLFKNGVVGFVSDQGSIRFVDGASGESVGSARIYGGVSVDPVASDSSMFVASRDQSIYAVNPNGGAVRWRKRTDTPLRHQPVHHEGRLYCAIDGTGMVAFDASSGKEIWTSAEVLGHIVGIRNGRLIAWDGHDAVTMDPASGSVVERVQLTDVAFLKTDKFVDGNLYAVTSRGVAAKFVPR